MHFLCTFTQLFTWGLQLLLNSCRLFIRFWVNLPLPSWGLQPKGLSDQITVQKSHDSKHCGFIEKELTVCSWELTLGIWFSVETREDFLRKWHVSRNLEAEGELHKERGKEQGLRQRGIICNSPLWQEGARCVKRTTKMSLMRLEHGEQGRCLETESQVMK